jgi:hypothetical protein
MIRDFIASRSGVRSESASSIMGIGGSMLMGLLGRQVSAQGLGASGLGELLRSQIPHVQGLLSPDLTRMLGIGNLFGAARPGAAPTPAPATTTTAYEPVVAGAHPDRRSGARALRWALIPLALLLAGLFLTHRYNREQNVGGSVDQTFRNTGAVTSTSLPTDIRSFGDRLKAAVATGGGIVTLEGVSFDSSSNLSPDARARLGMLAKTLNDNTSLKATITTYGKTLEESTDRGNAIKSDLANSGLSPDRVNIQPEVGDGVPKVSFHK